MRHKGRLVISPKLPNLITNFSSKTLSLIPAKNFINF